jgi:predicted DCC family thiol-disulfide oxidoreductase YuxK
MKGQGDIILFDGICNLCNRAVQFVIRHDRNKQFKFGSLQGPHGQEYLRNLNIQPDKTDSFLLIEDEKHYTRSTAALRVFKKLGGTWSLLYIFIVIPSFIRDALYDFIAHNRYRWFGKRNECMLPTEDLKARFLD